MFEKLKVVILVFAVILLCSSYDYVHAADSVNKGDYVFEVDEAVKDEDTNTYSSGTVVVVKHINDSYSKYVYKVYGSTLYLVKDEFDNIMVYGDGRYDVLTYWDDSENQNGSSFVLAGSAGGYTLPVTLVDGESYRNNVIAFYSNLPVFSSTDTESIENYKSTGDVSGSLNAEVFAEPDENIEMPVGLKVTGGYAAGIANAYSFDQDFIANWTQTVDTSDYMYDVQARCAIQLKKSLNDSSLSSEYYYSDWVDFGSKNYGGTNSITHRIYADNMNDRLLPSAMQNYVSQTGQQLTYKGYLISKLQVRIRNRAGDKCTNWVVVTVDNDSVSTTAQVENDDGNVVEDDEYTGDDVSDPTDGGTVTGDLDITSVLNYIRSGFGLLGDGGLISLMSGIFLYIPASIWTLIKMSISISIMLMILSLIKKFVF